MSFGGKCEKGKRKRGKNYERKKERKTKGNGK
jgi:hypothetical protein